MSFQSKVDFVSESVRNYVVILYHASNVNAYIANYQPSKIEESLTYNIFEPQTGVLVSHMAFCSNYAFINTLTSIYIQITFR